MDAVAEQRVLLGVDVIGSAATPGADLHRLSEAWRAIVQGALASAGIGMLDLLEWETQGDGALATLPHATLGKVVDMAEQLNELAVAHNRASTPEVRLRMVVDTGPVPTEPTYARAKIDRARLLEAPAFKNLLARCHREAEDGAHTGLIMSDHAFRTVFGGDHTALVREAEFAELAVATKEFQATAWVRVPGFDARTLKDFIAEAADTEAADEAPAPSGGAVYNSISGSANDVIQARDIHGGITFGHGPR
jgi:hypothetical protein